MLGTTGHLVSSKTAPAGRAAAALLACALVFGAAATARAETPDQDAVVSALRAPAHGAMQMTGYGDGRLDEPSRLLGGTVLGSMPVFEQVSVEIAGLGYHEASATPSSVGNTGVGLMAGLHFSLPSEHLRPYATARIAHLFHASDESWREHPIENIAGTTSQGLRHPVGASVGLGVEAPLGGWSSWRPLLDVGVHVVDRPGDERELVLHCQLRLAELDLGAR